jgi:DNA polymerase-3 subunit gamma/tau
LAQSLSAFLKKHSNQRWMVSVSAEQGADTISEQRETELDNLRAEVSKEPLVKAILEMFPGATLDEIIKEGELTPETVIVTDDDFDDLD